jgi:hypothetical protein
MAGRERRSTLGDVTRRETNADWEVGPLVEIVIERHARGEAMGGAMLLPPDQILISPWIDELIRRYGGGGAPQYRTPAFWMVTFALLVAGTALLPLLLRLDRAAYPSDPEKRAALDLCSSTDPTFIRFFAGERAACYARLRSSP